MDVTAEMRNIVLDTRAYVQAAPPDSIKSISKFTQNLLYILDNEKTAAYKLAIIAEYLENMQGILQKNNIKTLGDYLLDIKSPQEQQLACMAIQKMLAEYVDLHDLHPELVIFWLQCPCDVRSLKRMGAFMLFLSKEQQAKVINKDKTLLEDPLVQKIMNVFVTPD
jgi:hypothetical protein